MKKLLNEFKTFIMRGNVMDMAVGVIVGGAFQKIVSSLVNDIIMPLITLITGGIDFSQRFIPLTFGKTGDITAKTIEEYNKLGIATLNYGVFITTIINFILMAFVIFLLVKTLNVINDRANKIKEKEKAEEAPTTKICPHCLSEIPINATRCRYCTSELEAK